MISFNCIGNMSNTWRALETVTTWNPDDKIMTRDPFLKFAVFDGERFVGDLVNHNQLSMSLLYKVYYSGAPGAMIEQTGIPQLPVENVVLQAGVNWIGHAPLHAYKIDEIEPVGTRRFSADDQIKTRTGSRLEYSTFTGAQWAGGLSQLTPGSGYEFKVKQAVTFCYGKHCALTAPVPSPTSPPPPSPPSPPSPPPLCGCKQGCKKYDHVHPIFSFGWQTLTETESCVENEGTCEFTAHAGTFVEATVKCQTGEDDSLSANCFTPCERASPLPSPPPLSPSPPPPSPSQPTPPTSPPPSPPSPPPSPAPPPCKSSVDVEACKDDCDAAFGVCEDTDTKKACRKIKKKCKKTCRAATPCAPPPTCEDNVPINFGATWCTTNAKLATFCSGADGEKRCKKTCGLC